LKVVPEGGNLMENIQVDTCQIRAVLPLGTGATLEMEERNVGRHRGDA
jgi:hypothetical protein